MSDKVLIFKDKNVNLKNTINILIIIMVISGICGFIYETLFYRIDLGYFVKRGSTFGPWIPIYFFGGGLLAIFTYRFKDKPLIVFLLACLITGVLEYGTGYVLDELFHTRLWDYNIEIWNFGNINGYICLRSILLFGFANLFLIYYVIPKLISFSKKISEDNLTCISIILLCLFVIDTVTYQIIR